MPMDVGRTTSPRTRHSHRPPLRLSSSNSATNKTDFSGHPSQTTPRCAAPSTPNVPNDNSSVWMRKYPSFPAIHLVSTIIAECPVPCCAGINCRMLLVLSLSLRQGNLGAHRRQRKSRIPGQAAPSPITSGLRAPSPLGIAPSPFPNPKYIPTVQ